MRTSTHPRLDQLITRLHDMPVSQIPSFLRWLDQNEEFVTAYYDERAYLRTKIRATKKGQDL